MCIYLLWNIGKKRAIHWKKANYMYCFKLWVFNFTMCYYKFFFEFFFLITIKTYNTCSIHIRLYNILYNFYQIHPWSVHDLLKLIIGNFYVMLWFLFNIMIQTICKSNRGKRLTTRWLFDNPCLYLKLLKHYVF